MDLLVPLELPPYPFKITDDKGQLSIFDIIRKRKIILTPEEWVRQHFVQYLIQHKNYPKALIKLEGGHRLNGLARRSDIVVYNPAGERLLIVECKAPSVPIDQKVFDQVARYNMQHRAGMVAVTNGLQHYFCRINFADSSYAFIRELPDYREI